MFAKLNELKSTNRSYLSSEPVHKNIIIIVIIIIIIFITIKTLFTTQSEYLQINEYNAKTNRALCTKMSINFEELAYLRQNKSSQVKLST